MLPISCEVARLLRRDARAGRSAATAWGCSTRGRPGGRRAGRARRAPARAADSGSTAAGRMTSADGDVLVDRGGQLLDGVHAPVHRHSAAKTSAIGLLSSHESLPRRPPTGKLRFRAARVCLPDWARDAPDRCVFASNATGTFELYTWDRRDGRAQAGHRRPTARRDGFPVSRRRAPVVVRRHRRRRARHLAPAAVRRRRGRSRQRPGCPPATPRAARSAPP